MPVMRSAPVNVLRRAKYGNRRTVYDGVAFASAAEAKRYAELRLLARAGRITDLRCQPRYPLDVNNMRVAFYIADFAYTDAATNALVIEDVKSKPTKTAVYQLKRKLMKAIHGLDITEITR